MNTFPRVGAALILTGALVALGGTAAHAADGAVSGFVFRDFNSNGTYDTGNAAGSALPNDRPLAGVTVTAFDRSGAQVAQSTSASDGTYSLAVVGAQSAQLRVEFTFSSAQDAEGYESSYHGAGSGTSVQFVSIGATGVDFAANVPEDYVGSSPAVVVAAHRGGDPLAAGYPTSGPSTLTGTSSVVGFAWDKNSTDETDVSVDATANGLASSGVATGSLYGLGGVRGTDLVYGAAVLRRHIGLGVGGLGGIYSIDTASGVASLFLDLTTAGVDVGQSTFDAALSGFPGSTDNEKRGLTADPAVPSRDPVAWENAGKIGLGGLAVSSDGSTLYVVNLFQRTLLSIDIATKAVTEIPLDALGADERPFGVTVHRGQVFVGIVDTAESTGDRADLSARVISSPEPAGSWSTALEPVALDFQRGTTSTGPGPNLTGDVATHWNAWTEDFADAESAVFYGQDAMTNPQPLLSSLAFDADGNLVMGFLDRFGYQMGMLNKAPYAANDGPAPSLFAAFTAGSVYGASPDGDGTYTFESGGFLGGLEGNKTSGGGPGGGQYYDVASAIDPSSITGEPSHSNSLSGAVATIPGFSTLFATGYDLTGAWVSDAGWVPTNGDDRTLAQRVINNAADNNGTELTPGVGKAGGLGGVSVLADLAPVEIGNRTWYDADLDGVQDADEPAVPDVTVTLTDASGDPVTDAAGNPVSPVATDANGNYYFSNLVPNRSYLVHFDYSTADVSGLTADFGITSASQLAFTSQESASSTTGSNPDPATGVAAVDLGSAGQNDHTIDAGFIAYGYLSVAKVVTGSAAPTATKYTIELTCTDFRDESLALITLTLAGGEDSTQQLPAGTSCLVTETEDGDAVMTYYKVGTGTKGTTPPLVDVTGTEEVPTNVVITNEFGEKPVVPVLGSTGLTSWMTILPVGLLLFGAGILAFVIRGRLRPRR